METFLKRQYLFIEKNVPYDGHDGLGTGYGYFERESIQAEKSRATLRYMIDGSQRFQSEQTIIYCLATD